MALKSCSFCTGLLVLRVISAVINLQYVSAQAGDCLSDLEEGSSITVETECLQDEIKFTVNVTGSEDIGFVNFDVMCKTLAGMQLMVETDDIQRLEAEKEKSIPISSEAAECRTTICYEVNGYFTNDDFVLMAQPVCNYTVQCPSLQAPSHGEVTLSDGTDVFSVATYNCSPGFVLDVESRTCQIDGKWSGIEPSCGVNNTALEVNLTTNTSMAIVGCSIELTCSVNGSVPLMVLFEHNHSTIDAYTIDVLPQSDNGVIQRTSFYEVLEPSLMNFTCTVTNLTNDQASSVVQVTGVDRWYIQICFEVPQDVYYVTIDKLSEVLSSISSQILPNYTSVAPDCLESQNVPLSQCNESCPQWLFYSMAVVVEDVTELSANLLEWISVHDSITAGGMLLVPSSACIPVLAKAPSSPVCPPPGLSSNQASTSTFVPSEPMPTAPSGDPNEQPSSPTTSADELGDGILVIVFLAVIVLFATFVLSALTLVIVMFFFHKRRRHVSNFARECDLPVFDMMHRQQLEQQAFQQ